MLDSGFLGNNAAFVPDRGEGGAAFLKELVLPGVKLGGRDAVFGADFGDRFLFEEVKAQDSDFVFGAVSFTLLFGYVDGLDVRSIPLIQSGCCPIPTEAGQRWVFSTYFILLSFHKQTVNSLI